MYRLATISLELQKTPRRIFYPRPLAGTKCYIYLNICTYFNIYRYKYIYNVSNYILYVPFGPNFSKTAKKATSNFLPVASCGDKFFFDTLGICGHGSKNRRGVFCCFSETGVKIENSGEERPLRIRIFTRVWSLKKLNT